MLPIEIFSSQYLVILNPYSLLEREKYKSGNGYDVFPTAFIPSDS
jgi:hypothetical protein